MDILQQATQTLSSRSSFTTHHSGTAIARPSRTRQQENCKRGLPTTLCAYSHNPNDAERMLLASSNTTYAAPLEPSSGSSFIIRPLAEILRDLNKKVPDQVLKDSHGDGNRKYIPWYHANRMLSFYAPGWCGEVRNIAFSADAKFITVVYRVILRGSDGETKASKEFKESEIQEIKTAYTKDPPECGGILLKK
ncbi:hypothetical protein GOP47_0017407 [Adiantum capillus-veneris]|uniref:Uncharacterized protein n=1 Tax=Adiantum capillus-veneris TaxID=13818 RepID=A0A9D4Z9N7_ADICA|nr:hypothetical protein GOP47_0017407 [Adiantum capillus-veneris]